MQQLTRRNAVLGALGTGIVALAGCVSDSGDDPESATDDQRDNDNRDETAGPTDFDVAIEGVGSDCAGVDPGDVAVFLDDGAYVVQGTIPSPTPCYEPVVDSKRFDDGTLSLTVDVTTEEDGPCVDCVGEIYYDATISGADPAEVETVSITHAGGQTHETPAEDIPEGVPRLVDAEITDSESRPRDGEEEGSAEVSEIDDSGETGAITITGEIPTETPHYEPVLTEVRLRGGTLSVTVDVESTREEDQMGYQVTGLVEYTTRVELEHPAGIDSAQIQHPNARYGSSWASDSAAAGRGTTGSDSGSGGSESR